MSRASTLICRLALLCCSLLLQSQLMAHEVRPASLAITELDNGSLEFRFRQPTSWDYTIAIKPVLSSGWLDAAPQQRLVSESGLIRLWRVENNATPLAGQELSISGLDSTITDVFISISYLSGVQQHFLLSAAQASVVLPDEAQASATLSEYLWLGLSHIASGPDHLLYVLALMLLISGTRSLLITISAFTLAHSITLACSALHIVQLASGPVEALISLSIVYVALELVYAQRGKTGLASKRPWIIAFVFGLLHGFGFAGALQEIGLPQQSVLSALFLFNIGIELGQVLFVSILLALFLLLKKLLPQILNHVAKMRLLVSYGIGSLASFWLITRLLSLL